MMIMTKKDEDKITDIVVGAIQSVVLPILEDHSNKLNNLTEDVEYLKDKVDSHTASLMELEKLPSLIGEVYQEVKGMRVQLRDHEERIIKVENQVGVT